VEQRTGANREAMQAGFAAPPGRAVRPATVIDDGAAAFRAERIAVVARPPDLADTPSASASDMRATDASVSVLAAGDKRKCCGTGYIRL
jgi:hypothetical protein